MNNDEGQVRRTDAGGVATLVFDRPGAHNAMTWTMYEQLEKHCRAIAEDAGTRVVVLRGAGGKAFVSGTAIDQFLAFTSDEDGITYEQRIDAVVASVESLPQPTLAVVEGWCMGGGLAIATVCDVRIAGESARFGVPIARTVGNCLSMANTVRLVAALGIPLAKRLLVGAEVLTAQQALAAGFVSEVVQAEDMTARVDATCARLLAQAPLTMHAAKEMMLRIQHSMRGADEDIIRRVYGSADFKEGVESFVARRPPVWQGR